MSYFSKCLWMLSELGKNKYNKTMQSKARGFTLIELLTVIAIIGLLAAVALASLSLARQKSRDAKRIAEVSQITRAVELYYDVHQTYPSTTPSGFSGDDAGIQVLVAAKLLPVQPIPPQGTDATYLYHGIYSNAGVPTECTAVGTACSSYEIGITLERDDSPALDSDADQNVGSFFGSSAACATSIVGQEKCFDVKL